MSSNHEDPDVREIHEAQLTAYAIGQLNAKEREAAETLMAQSEKARQFVEETAALATHVLQAYQQAPAPAASASLRTEIEKRLRSPLEGELATANVMPQRNRNWLRRHWLGLAVAGTCACVLVGLLLPSLQSARSVARHSNPISKLAANQSAAEASVDRPGSNRAGNDLEYWEPEADSKPEPSQPGQPLELLKPGETPGEQPLFDQSSGVAAMGDTKLSGERSFGGGEASGGRKGGGYDSGDGGKGGVGVRVGDVRGQGGIGYGPRAASGPRKGQDSVVGKPSGQSPYYMQDDVQYSPPPKTLGLRSRYSASIREIEEQYPGLGSSPGSEQYDHTADNRFLSVARQPLSTFSIDVDTASYANVRRFLSEGRLPPPEAVRIEEMVNYFRYDYSPPSGQTPFSVQMETAECPWQPAHRLVRIGLKGREIDRQERGSSNFVFLLDVSGSMGEPNKLPLVKQAMRMLVEQLHADDRVAIVTYASGTDVRLPSARGNERPRIIDAIEALQAGGCTYGSAGIELAYQQAAEYFIPKGVNRVILCTDGDLNVGVTNDNDLVKLIQRKAKSGVFLTVLGFGTGNLKDGKLEKLADHGNGVYAYIDSLREAHRVLVEQMTGTLVTIAKDVKIQVEFNPAEVAGYRLVGYEKRMLANRDFNNDRKDAGDIGAGHTVTALYEIVPARAGRGANEEDRPLKYQRVPEENLTENAHNGELLTLRLRYKEPEENKSRLLEFAARDSGARFGRASSDFRFASAVAAFGMVLRGSPQRGEATLAAVEEYAAAALGKDPNGHRAEFLDLVRKARSLSPER